MKRKFTGVIEKRGKWYVGYVEDLPGANAQGKTLAEIRANLKEAILLILGARREIQESGPRAEKTIREEITIDA